MNTLGKFWVRCVIQIPSQVHSVIGQCRELHPMRIPALLFKSPMITASFHTKLTVWREASCLDTTNKSLRCINEWKNIWSITFKNIRHFGTPGVQLLLFCTSLKQQSFCVVRIDHCYADNWQVSSYFTSKMGVLYWELHWWDMPILLWNYSSMCKSNQMLRLEVTFTFTLHFIKVPSAKSQIISVIFE